MRRPIAFLASALTLVLGVVPGCGGSGGDRHGPPVVVLAIDGLEWSVLRPMLTDGRAPNLRRLADRGVAGLLSTDVPTFSPMLWTSVATGAKPRQHGILHFAETDPATGEMKPGGLPYTSNSRKLPAIWNVCGGNGRSVLSVGWWVSWPAEPVPGGRIVASYAAQAQAQVLWKAGVWTDGLEELTFPPALQDDIAPLLREGAPEGPLQAEFEADFALVPRGAAWPIERMVERNLRFTFHGDRTHHRIFLSELERRVADLNLVYFGVADVAGHFFWRYREPGAYDYAVPEHKVELLGERVEEVYGVVDRWVGEVLERLPDDAYVLVLSDHGMHAARPDEPRHLSSGGHDDGPPGIVIAAGPGIRAAGLPAGEPEVLGSIYDVFPTLLTWLALPVPDDAVGSARRGWMEDGWNAAHPPASVATYAAGFRAATPPRAPGNQANEEFLEGMKALGYF
ncbi:MAG: alkaline phosphatase family protein [Planctomycetota bacterium]